MTGAKPTDQAGALLAQLEQGLQRQLELIAGSDFDGLAKLFNECDSLFAQLPPADLDAERHAERIERIGRVNAKIGLALAQKREELSEMMRHRRKGRAGLGAYRRALS